MDAADVDRLDEAMQAVVTDLGLGIDGDAVRELVAFHIRRVIERPSPVKRPDQHRWSTVRHPWRRSCDYTQTSPRGPLNPPSTATQQATGQPPTPVRSLTRGPGTAGWSSAASPGCAPSSANVSVTNTAPTSTPGYFG